LLNSNVKLNIDLEEKEIKLLKKNLRSIILNLLSNAVKFRSYDRELEVSIRSQRVDGFIVLSVQDNGIGIAKEKVSKLFTKFHRLHDLDLNVEGTGIGLYLVKKIISNAGGGIEVESTLGKGSCFKVYFKDEEKISVGSFPSVASFA
ncbi:MAG: ATP-binding protein, partial [Bacteroidota bacterium]|nr:ATP-binding protein [Bacteroidota bacterium]